MPFPSAWAARRRDGTRPRESTAGRVALAILTATTLVSIVMVAALSLGLLTGRVRSPSTFPTALTPAASPPGERADGAPLPPSLRPPAR